MEKEHLILVILGSILVFLLIREFLCWYWKINAALSRLDRIAGRLDGILEDQLYYVRRIAAEEKH